MKVNELFEGVDTPRKRPQSQVQYGVKVAAEQLRKMGLKVRIGTRVIGKYEKSNRTVMTVIGDIEEKEILKVLKKNEVEYATVGSTTRDDGQKTRMIRLVNPVESKQLAEEKYEPKMFYVINNKNLVLAGPFTSMGDASVAQSKINNWSEIKTGSYMQKYFGDE